MQHEQILKVLDDLLRIPSVSSDIPELERVVNYIEGYFAEHENAVIKKYSFNEKTSIVIQNFEGLEADIILNGHFDVVPASEEGQFKPYEADGKIYARGSGDMKGGDAIMMAVMKEILEKNFTRKKICLMLTADEEVGGEDGVKKLVEMGYTARDCVLIPDSGSVNEITIAEKGIIDFDVEMQGVSCHSSRPWLGKNAVDSLFQLSQELKKAFQEDDKLKSESEYWGSTVELTMVQGGNATNVIPASATGHFNIRATETFADMKKTFEMIEEIVKRCNGKITGSMIGPLVHTPESADIIQSYLTTAKKILQRDDIALIREHGASDGRFFGEKGIPVILHRPDTDFIHSKGEYVKKQALFDIYKVYHAFIFDR